MGQADLPQDAGRFTCNICGTGNKSTLHPSNREEVTCLCCRSSMRFRGIVLSLSRALFGMDLRLDQFPVLKRNLSVLIRA